MLVNSLNEHEKSDAGPLGRKRGEAKRKGKESKEKNKKKQSPIPHKARAEKKLPTSDHVALYPMASRITKAAKRERWLKRNEVVDRCQEATGWEVANISPGTLRSRC